MCWASNIWVCIDKKIFVKQGEKEPDHLLWLVGSVKETSTEAKDKRGKIVSKTWYLWHSRSMKLWCYINLEILFKSEKETFEWEVKAVWFGLFYFKLGVYIHRYFFFSSSFFKFSLPLMWASFIFRLGRQQFVLVADKICFRCPSYSWKV